jgi:ferredoxin
MNVIHIDKNDWTRGIDKARESFRLFGPVKDTDVSIFRGLGPGEYPDLALTDSVMSPKSVLFPQTEPMLTATLDESKPEHHIYRRADADYSPRAVIGIRPYDAKAVQLVKLNFDTKEYRDPYWCDACEATTFVGLAVNRPSRVDFSTSAGSGPFGEEGLDVLLVDAGSRYLAKVLTPKGETFMAKAGFVAPADPGAAAEIDRMKAEAEAFMAPGIETDKLKALTILDLYEAPFWNDLAFSCINCGTCTYVCPTCWCFDIQDETRGKACTRLRNWDTCMSPLFTLHGSGHNPRGEKTQRVRQRFMHKLKYFLDKYDQGIMCVGCGRCVRECPVNIDIRDVATTMNAYKPRS